MTGVFAAGKSSRNHDKQHTGYYFRNQIRHKIDIDSNPFSRLHSGSFRGIFFRSSCEHNEHSIVLKNGPLRRSEYRKLRA